MKDKELEAFKALQADLGPFKHSVLDDVIESPGLLENVDAMIPRLVAEAAPEKWKRAIKAISEDPLYRGVALKAQVDLIPLGKDLKSGLWEFAHALSGEVPKREGGQLVLSADTGVVLVLIPDGCFSMGSDGGDSDERSVHEVTITQPYYLGKYEVTQAQWKVVMGDNPSRFQGGPQRPVERVSWNRVQAFMTRLNELAGRSIYRLPTEAEWEYAARAGSTTAYHFGDDEGQLGDYAWYAENSDNRTHPVGQKQPNAWGLYDMHGNVWEWVQDWYGDYSPVKVVDPTGPIKGVERVLRGGCWIYSGWVLRSAYRLAYVPGFRSLSIGFRLARGQVSSK